jgi:hypothetical protein
MFDVKRTDAFDSWLKGLADAKRSRRGSTGWRMAIPAMLRQSVKA